LGRNGDWVQEQVEEYTELAQGYLAV
jgi:hypothetical protein